MKSLIKLAFVSLVMSVLVSSSLWALEKVSNTITASDRLIDYGIQKLDGMIAATQKTLTVVTQTLLDVTKYDCLVNIGMGTTLFVFALITLWWTALLFKWKVDEVVYFFLGVLPTVILFVSSITYLLDFWLYICVAHPDTYLIHQALEKVVN